MGHYAQVVQKLQKILDLMTGLRKVRENIPRKETVVPVFKQRRELVRIGELALGCLPIYAMTDVLHLRFTVCMRASIQSTTASPAVPAFI
jgi:hypothetical protein